MNNLNLIKNLNEIISILHENKLQIDQYFQFFDEIYLKNFKKDFREKLQKNKKIEIPEKIKTFAKISPENLKIFEENLIKNSEKIEKIDKNLIKKIFKNSLEILDFDDFLIFLSFCENFEKIKNFSANSLQKILFFTKIDEKFIKKYSLFLDKTLKIDIFFPENSNFGKIAKIKLNRQISEKNEKNLKISEKIEKISEKSEKNKKIRGGKRKTKILIRDEILLKNLEKMSKF